MFFKQTLKKNQVDKHTYSCRSCRAVTCVDCSVTFYGNDYAAHTTCISEAQKYEGSLYKPKTNAKPKAQDLWTALIENIEAKSNDAPASVKPYLSTLSSLGNVPRNQKKFINFAKNSLRLQNEKILQEIWNFLESARAKEEASYETAPKSITAAPAPAAPQLTTETVTEEKKQKKRKHDNDEEEAAPQAEKKSKTEAVLTETAEEVAEDSDNSKKEKKHKKSKKEKKHKKDKE